MIWIYPSLLFTLQFPTFYIIVGLFLIFPTHQDDVLPTVSSQSTCSPVWDQLINRLSYGGMLFTLATSLNECQSACISNLGCLAVDIDRNVSPVQCYLHTNPNAQTFAATGVDHYTLTQRCINIESNSSSTATPCYPQWNNLTNTNSFGASQYTQYTTVDSCLNFCLSLAQCVAVDINNSSGSGAIQCWVHNSSANIVNKNSFVGINQYVLVNRCSNLATSCTSQWNNLTNTNSFGASQYTQYTTVDSCLNFCLSLAQCVAVDINNSSGSGAIQCWVHNSSANIVNKNSFVGINQYVLVNRCSTGATGSTISSFTLSTKASTSTETSSKPTAGSSHMDLRGDRSDRTTSCTPQWNNLTNTNSFGASQYTQYTTVDSCLNFCLSLAQCVAVDINNSSGSGVIQCWVHNSSANIVNKNSFVGINQYVLVNRCIANTPCYPQWNNLTNTNSFGASEYTQYTTVDSCLNFCLSLAQCVAVDINNSSGSGAIQCWVHNSSDNIVNKNPFVGINQYVLVNRCGIATTSCTLQWNNLTNTNSFGASQYTQYTTVDSCLSFCLSLAQCVAVDINNSSGSGAIQCWVHNSSVNIVNKNSFVGINQYILVNRCSNLVTTSSVFPTTTTATRPACMPSWLTKPKTHSLGGILYSNCSSQAICLQCCLTISSCVGVDVDSFFIPAQCFIYSNAMAFTANQNSTTVTQYQLINRCASQIACNSPGYRYCKTMNQCFPSSSFCDGIPDCNDNSDELGCTSVCAANEFSCGGSLCLLNTFWCNGFVNCPDGSDEAANCQPNCPSSAFHCADGSACIGSDQVCDGYRSCPDGSDERNCPTVCPGDQFSCSNNGVCRNLTSWCNNVRDCPDNSDEPVNCQTGCPAGYVRCSTVNGLSGTGCIPAGKWCDGFSQDCSDGSDEATGCVCPGNSHRCPHGCIPRSLVCDGLLHCSDGSDEASCPCTSGHFKCKHGACISDSLVCDGQNSCGDFSDEFVCGVCNQLELSCSSVCLNRSKVCNGFVDCPNEEDEQNCTYSGCSSDQFSCDNGRCLSNDLRCNNIFDCFDLSDELNCSSICLANRGVPCDNGLCLLPYQWCDGRVDCTDASDEKRCSCAAPNFECRDGLCLLPSQRCNGVFDCADRQDEFNCTCSQYQCPRSLCISQSVRCDGVKDCPDGYDETNCGNGCNATQFQCAVDFRCITLSKKCNGIDDCIDASDERSCLSLYSTSAELSIGPLLVDPPSPASLVVKYAGSTSYRVCSDGWSSSWSDVACQEMGYVRSNVTSSEANVRSYLTVVLSGDAIGPTLLSSLVIGRCASNRYILFNCIVKTCGKQIVGENLLDTYIENGAAAGVGSLPWQAAIYRDSAFVCSGSLLNERWILTSAQCLLASNSLQISDVSKVSVRLGSVYLASYDAGLQVRFPDRFVIHPLFNNFTHESDVGLIRLSKPVQTTTSVNPVCLSNNKTTISHFEVCLTSGWVRLVQGERNVGNVLTQMRTSLVPLPQCRVLLRQSRNTFIPQEDSILCGISAALPTNINCLADLGRPWVCKDDSSTWTQIGLVTGDTSCGGVTLFTKLSTFYDWIQGVVGT